MSDPNEDFAKSAVDAMGTEGSEGAPSNEGTEPAGSGDADLAAFAKTLKEAGVTPEKARESVQLLAYIQTPQGQEAFLQNMLASDAGARLRENFGREQLASILAQPGGAERIMGIAREMGHDIALPSANDDELTAPEKEIRAMKTQQAALEAKIRSLSEGQGSKLQALEAQLRGREDAEAKRDVFVTWTKTAPKMAQQAYSAVAKRAYELSALRPGEFGGPQGFKRAIAEAYSEKTSEAKYFQEKPRPRGSTSLGGGVAGSASVDESKLTLTQKIDRWAEDVAAHARGQE